MAPKMRFLFAFVAVFATLAFVSCGDTPGVPGIDQKGEKFKITFDSTKMDCKKGEQGDGGDFASGTEIESGQQLKFTAKLEGDDIIANWYVGGIKNESETKTDFVYKVSSGNANQEKIITIAYKTHALRIKFDESMITCRQGFPGNYITFPSDTKVSDGKEYQFVPKLGDKEIVEAWYVGENKQDLKPSKHPFTYKVKKQDADKENVITISCKKKQE